MHAGVHSTMRCRQPFWRQVSRGSQHPAGNIAAIRSTCRLRTVHADAADGSHSGQSGCMQRGNAAGTSSADHPISIADSAALCRPALRPRCWPGMVRTRRAEDLKCGDGRLDSSPYPPSAASCASCASWDSEPQPLEEFPLQCTDQDHVAELRMMQLREQQEIPAQTWLLPEGHQKVLSAKHRRFLVSWLLTVRSL